MYLFTHQRGELKRIWCVFCLQHLLYVCCLKTPSKFYKMLLTLYFIILVLYQHNNTHGLNCTYTTTNTQTHTHIRILFYVEYVYADVESWFKLFE